MDTYIRNGIAPTQLQERQPIESKKRKEKCPHRYTGFGPDTAKEFEDSEPSARIHLAGHAV